MHQGLIAMLTELVCGVILGECRANAIGSAASRAADAPIDFVTLAAVKVFRHDFSHNFQGKGVAAFWGFVSSFYRICGYVFQFFSRRKIKKGITPCQTLLLFVFLYVCILYFFFVFFVLFCGLFKEILVVFAIIIIIEVIV